MYLEQLNYQKDFHPTLKRYSIKLESIILIQCVDFEEVFDCPIEVFGYEISLKYFYSDQELFDQNYIPPVEKYVLGVRYNDCENLRHFYNVMSQVIFDCENNVFPWFLSLSDFSCFSCFIDLSKKIKQPTKKRKNEEIEDFKTIKQGKKNKKKWTK
eukprot:gene3264-5707_t